MVSRFLLGAGLGGLVGTGVLALLSVSFSGPFPQQRGALAPQAAGEESAPAVSPATDPTPAAGPGAEPAGEGSPAADMTSAEEAAPEGSSGSAVAPELAEAPAAADLAAPQAPGAETAPDPALPEAEADPARIAGGAPAQPEPLPSLAAEPEAAPAAPEAPAAAPDIAAAAAPDAPDLPPAGGSAAAPLAEEAPATALAEASRPEGPAEEEAPGSIDGPQPPPLTAEEKAMLAELDAEAPEAPAAETSPAVAEDAALAEAPVTPAEGVDPGGDPAGADVPEIPDLATAGAADTPAEDQDLEGEAAPIPPVRRIALENEGSTLPSTPALDVAGGGAGAPLPEAGRLPRIGDGAGGAEAPAAAPDAEAELALPAPATEPRALYARAFDNPGDRPLFAIILIDDGAADLDRQALAALPFPVSFALDPQLPGSEAQAALYRAAGQEVIMLASGLPKGASASDVEVVFEAMGRALPEAVAVMDLPGLGFQNDRPLASLVVPVVEGQGRGLVTWSAGLNAADQVAKREDVPATVVFRDLDSGGEEAPVIRRYLDRAAFKAVQEGRVTVVGRTRPDTVAALLEWSLEGRAATVALAPVTAVLSID